MSSLSGMNPQMILLKNNMKYVPLLSIQIRSLRNEWIDLYFVMGTNKQIYTLKPTKIKPLSIHKKKLLWCQESDYEQSMNNLVGS